MTGQMNSRQYEQDRLTVVTHAVARILACEAAERRSTEPDFLDNEERKLLGIFDPANPTPDQKAIVDILMVTAREGLKKMSSGESPAA